MISVDFPANTFPLKNLGVPHMLLEAGAETLQVTWVVDSVMGLGVTVTVAPLMLKVLRILFAAVVASEVDPPGTITNRQAS